VEGRGFLRGLGFGGYAAWIENGPIQRRAFGPRSGVYGEVRPTRSLVLGTVGVCSTVMLAGVLVGTDKIDHFWAVGWHYARRSRWGEEPERSVAWGTLSERTWWGLLTSNAFSFGDLRANWDGERFYTTLLAPGSVLRLDEDGCVERVGGWDWGEWVTPAWDEAILPPVLGRNVERAVERHLAHGAVCASYGEWGPAYEALREATLAEPKPWMGSRAPSLRDPWRFHDRCGVP
jgi:hypothetical protein